MLVIRAGVHKKFVRISNREDPDQTKDLGLHSLSRPFSQGISYQNFRTSTIVYKQIEQVIKRSKVDKWKSA